MAQQKIELADLAEHLGSVSSTHMLLELQFQGHPLLAFIGIAYSCAQTKHPYTLKKKKSSKNKVQSKEEGIYLPLTCGLRPCALAHPHTHTHLGSTGVPDRDSDSIS